MIGIVVCQNLVQIQTGFLQRIEAPAVCIAAGGIGRTVGAIAAEGENRGAGKSGDALTGRQGELLVPARRDS